MQQTNTGDGGKVRIWGGISGFGTTNANIYTENMNGELYCDVLQNEVKQILAKNLGTRKNDVSTRFSSMAHIKHFQGKNSQTKVKTA